MNTANIACSKHVGTFILDPFSFLFRIRRQSTSNHYMYDCIESYHNLELPVSIYSTKCKYSSAAILRTTFDIKNKNKGKE